MEYYIIKCPHCNDEILIYKKNIKCEIFRHGVYRNNLKGINPHESKKECDRLFNENLIYGCGKPFKFDGTNLSICDYL